MPFVNSRLLTCPQASHRKSRRHVQIYLLTASSRPSSECTSGSLFGARSGGGSPIGAIAPIDNRHRPDNEDRRYAASPLSGADRSHFVSVAGACLRSSRSGAGFRRCSSSSTSASSRRQCSKPPRGSDFFKQHLRATPELIRQTDSPPPGSACLIPYSSPAYRGRGPIFWETGMHKERSLRKSRS